MAIELFVPGCLCLFGEHSDWASGYRRVNADLEKGYTLVTGTNQGIYARVEAHPGKLVLYATLSDGAVEGPYEIPMERDALLHEAEKGGFFQYAAGVAYHLLLHYQVRGAIIDNYRTDLPIGKGLASSAAASVLTARAFNRLYDLKMTVRGEMEYAYLGEVTTPSRCTRMHQAGAFGTRPILMVHDRDTVTVKELTTKGELYLVIVDLNASKNVKEILARLNRCYPFAEHQLERNVQRCLGAINKQTTLEAVKAIETGDAQRLGHLMTEAQKTFDEGCAPMCPTELQAPVLHKVLAYPPIQQHIWGGKGVGSQGDGTAQLVARSRTDQAEVIRIIENDLEMPCRTLNIVAAKKIRKAVIPAAGFGSRMYPASKAVKNELLPIITADGMAKPIILEIIEEALAAGIEEVCLIVQEGDDRFFDEFFNSPIEPIHFHKLPDRLKQYHAHLGEVGSRVRFVTQQVREGFGHAVYCARSWVGDEPFLLMLGDHLYASDTDAPCAQQIIDVYQRQQANVVGLKRTPEHLISNFGTVAGRWIEEGRVLNITEFAEKPSVDYARTNLRVDGLEQGEYLTIFGQYILKPDIFDLLEEIIRNNLRERGEFQLTTALERLRKDEGFLGYITEGQRFDIGTPEIYLETINAYRLAR